VLRIITSVLNYLLYIFHETAEVFFIVFCNFVISLCVPITRKLKYVLERKQGRKRRIYLLFTIGQERA